MKLERHVTCAIDDFGAGKIEPALMHACFAIDGTTKRLFGTGGRRKYKQFLRDHYWIVQAMMGNGIDIAETIWNNLELKNDKGELIHNPDIADIVYHVFRCSHAHADDVPKEFDIMRTTNGESYWDLSADSVKIPDVIVWALIAVSVFSKINKGSTSEGDYYLECGGPETGTNRRKFIIKDNWGNEDVFRNFVGEMKLIRVKIDKLERLRETRFPSAP